MYVYLIGAYNRFGKATGLKIGVAADPAKRIKQLQTGNSDGLRLIAHWNAQSEAKAYAIEAEAHHKFRNHRMLGEWFYPKKLDKIIFWMNARANSGPSFMDGNLCEFYLMLARNHERKATKAA